MLESRACPDRSSSTFSCSRLTTDTACERDNPLTSMSVRPSRNQSSSAVFDWLSRNITAIDEGRLAPEAVRPDLITSVAIMVISATARASGIV
jgi:hypothetical protein